MTKEDGYDILMTVAENVGGLGWMRYEPIEDTPAAPDLVVAASVVAVGQQLERVGDILIKDVHPDLNRIATALEAIARGLGQSSEAGNP